MVTHTLSLGPLSLLAEQHGPLLTITIHALSDTAPVGRMTLTVPEWTALVALVDCMALADRDSLRQQVRELTEERDWLRARDENNGCAHLPWCDDMGMDNHDPSCPANAVTLQCEASQLRSDLSAALVSVDAMAKRLEQLQPIVSVLGDWDWQAIRDEGCWRDDEYIDAMRAAVKALAHTASEQGKESK